MTITTHLPDLPFTNHANAELVSGPHHSAPESTPRSYPRTDLETLRAWTTFPDDIHRAIASATTSAQLPSTPFRVKAETDQDSVENEETLRAFAAYALHKPVREVLRKLGVNGRFTMPGSGNSAVVGDPDFSWVTSDAETKQGAHPKLIVEYKTWWEADLANVVPTVNCTHRDILDQDSLHALEQTYGYLCFNNNKYGILTNWRRSLVLRRAEVLGLRTLDFYTVELDGNPDISMLKAWVGMILLAEADWFYASPTPNSAPPNQTFGTLMTSQKELKSTINNAQQYQMQPSGGTYECRALDFRLCHFDLSTTRRGSNGCTVTARLAQSPIIIINRDPLEVICKIIDISRYPDAAGLQDNEVRAYIVLKNLQGKVIPTFYGFYIVWGILRMITLEHVGEAITENELINQQLRQKMRDALCCIHKLGYVHGDVARRNFCRRPNGQIFLVDLERCRPGNQAEQLNEIDVVDRL